MDVLLVVAVLGGLYMAWGIGANDVANAMGTSVGSRAITFRQAVVLAAIFEFLGAVLVGTHVTQTVRKGIIDPSQFTQTPELLLCGMVAALLGAAVWLHVASYFGQPVSTTHSIVGALVGFGLVTGGAIKWAKLTAIVLSWIVSPLMGAAIGFVLFRLVARRVLASAAPAVEVRRLSPVLVFLVALILTLSLIYKGLKNLHLNFPFWQALGLALAVALLAAAATKWLIRRRAASRQIPDDIEGQLGYAEGVFRYLQAMTACYVAFAHGANDVANAVGPVAAVVSIRMTGEVAMKVGVPVWVLLLGGLGIVAGLTTFGRHVIETVGRKITDMTPSRGFAATFAAATTVLVCSKLGLPISTTHTLVGAVIGVGIARGIGGVDARVVRQIFGSWVATIPLVATLSAGIYLLLRLTV